jgi:hypothetical protein
MAKINRAMERAKSRRARARSTITYPDIVVRNPSDGDAGLLAAWRFTSDAELDRLIRSEPAGSERRPILARVKKLRQANDYR